MERFRRAVSGQVIAESVSWEDYLRDYAADHAEWVEGKVIRLSPVTRIHNALLVLLTRLLQSYLEVSGEGELFVDPFVMRLPEISARQPDLQVVRTANLGRAHFTYVDGPADLVIEIVSPESDTRDRVEKFSEYERGGVGEYWIIDPLYQEAAFYRREADGVFQRVNPEDGVYRCAVLPHLQIAVAWLWRKPPMTSREIEQVVAAMLDSAP